jgi:hypothetical protein
VGGGGGGFRRVRFNLQSQAEKNRSARDFIALDRQIGKSFNGMTTFSPPCPHHWDFNVTTDRTRKLNTLRLRTKTEATQFFFFFFLVFEICTFY